MPNSFKQLFDELDIAILGHLEKDGRKSQSDIAADLGVTVSTIGNRLKRLRDEDLLAIYGFLDPHRVGFNAPALVRVSVKPEDIEKVGEKIADLPEVLSVTVTTGEFQLLVEVQCRDNEHLTDLIVNRLQQVEGIRETRTSILLREIMIKQADVKMLFLTNQPDQLKNVLQCARCKVLGLSGDDHQIGNRQRVQSQGTKRGRTVYHDIVIQISVELCHRLLEISLIALAAIQYLVDRRQAGVCRHDIQSHNAALFADTDQRCVVYDSIRHRTSQRLRLEPKRERQIGLGIKVDAKHRLAQFGQARPQ